MRNLLREYATRIESGNKTKTDVLRMFGSISLHDIAVGTAKGLTTKK